MPHQLISQNSSSVALRLLEWPDSGCHIQYFTVQYRQISDGERERWILVSNALKPHRKFIISNLKPSTYYQLRVEAHNSAGSTTADFSFATLTVNGGLRDKSYQIKKNLSLFHSDVLPIDAIPHTPSSRPFYYDVKFLMAVIIIITIIICTIALTIICFKCRKIRFYDLNFRGENNFVYPNQAKGVFRRKNRRSMQQQRHLISKGIDFMAQSTSPRCK